jgi:putative ABC transport system permease protein
LPSLKTKGVLASSLPNCEGWVRIVTLIVREVAAMLVAGSLVGGAAAFTLTGLAQKMLFGITPTEPGVFALAALILGVTAFTAGWLPALRASRVDPMTALRHD